MPTRNVVPNADSEGSLGTLEKKWQAGHFASLNANNIFLNNRPARDDGRAGQSFVSYGDSITNQNQWQPHVVSLVGVSHTKLGVDGRLVSGSVGLSSETAINTIPLDADIVTVLGGTNDWTNSVPMGVSSDFLDSTFYGALRLMAFRLYARVPTARLLFLTTPYGEDAGWVAKGWANNSTNTLGLGAADYANAVRVVAQEFNIPYVDVNLESSVIAQNISSFAPDGIHPNALWGERIGRAVAYKLLAL